MKDSTSNFEDETTRDALSNFEDKSMRYKSSQDKESDDIGKSPVGDDELRLSQDKLLNNTLKKENVCKSGVALQPEMNYEVTNKINCWDNGNGGIENKLHTETRRAHEDENGVSSESLTNPEDVNIVEIRKFHLVSTKNTSLDITFVS